MHSRHFDNGNCTICVVYTHAHVLPKAYLLSGKYAQKSCKIITDRSAKP